MSDTGPDRDTPGLTGRVIVFMLGALFLANLGIMGWGLSRMLTFHAMVEARLAKMATSHEMLHGRLETVETQVGIMRGNRFTAEDGKDVYKRMADLSSAVAGLQAMNERLARIEARLDNLLDKLMTGGIRTGGGVP